MGCIFLDNRYLFKNVADFSRKEGFASNKNKRSNGIEAFIMFMILI